MITSPWWEIHIIPPWLVDGETTCDRHTCSWIPSFSLLYKGWAGSRARNTSCSLPKVSRALHKLKCSLLRLGECIAFFWTRAGNLSQTFSDLQDDGSVAPLDAQLASRSPDVHLASGSCRWNESSERFYLLLSCLFIQNTATPTCRGLPAAAVPARQPDGVSGEGGLPQVSLGGDNNL